MQLRLPLLLIGIPIMVAAAAPAAANTEATSRVTYFREPSSDNKGIQVIHPQVNASAALGSTFNLNAAYEVDIVSGATPSVFRPRSSVDAVSSATPFSDTRHQAGGGFSFDRPTSGIAFSGSYGWESDYRSITVSGVTRTDLLDHNFTLALGYTHNFDEVCDTNNIAVASQPLSLKALTSSAHCFTGDTDPSTMRTYTTKHRLHIDTLEPSLTWTATPRLVIQGGGTIQILDGFQSNPYRRVLVGSSNHEPQEREPELRQRYALFARAAYAFADTRASVMVLGRIYRDSWAVQAATSELIMQKYFGNALLLAARGRFHIQEGASFYRDARNYVIRGPAGSYWTGDRELSPMSNYLAGGKLAFLRRPAQEKSSWFVEMELDLKVEVLVYRLKSPDAPNADRSFAHIWQGAFAMRF